MTGSALIGGRWIGAYRSLEIYAEKEERACKLSGLYNMYICMKNVYNMLLYLCMDSVHNVSILKAK